MTGPALVTGFPGALAAGMVRRLLQDGVPVLMLVDEVNAREVEDLVHSLPRDRQELLTPLYGRPNHMDLGLSGGEVRRITEEVTTIYLLSGMQWPGHVHPEAARLLLGGTREVLAIAHECQRLERLTYFSSAFVAGRRNGVVLEEQARPDVDFRNEFERTLVRAERMVQDASTGCPTTLLRPTVIIGDSVTGEFDPLSGGYYLFDALVHWPREVPLPMPGDGDAPLHLVPLDFVVEAAYSISRHAEAVGRIFHLTDPNPLPARRVVELITGRSVSPAAGGRLSTGIARAVLDLPVVRELWGQPRNLLSYFFDQPVLYRSANLLQALNDTPLRCPDFEDYAATLVAWLRSVAARDLRERSKTARSLSPWRAVERTLRSR